MNFNSAKMGHSISNSAKCGLKMSVTFSLTKYILKPEDWENTKNEQRVITRRFTPLNEWKEVVTGACWIEL